MSTSVGIDLAIVSLASLIEAVKDLNLAREELKQLEDCKGVQRKVDFVIVNEVGERIGVAQTAEGQVEFVTQKAESKTAAATINQVKQAYARLRILDEVKRKGYQQVKQEKLADGSIRLVVQKWR